MPATRLKFGEFLDALLVRLYELDSDEGPRFFNLDQIVGQMAAPPPRGWIFDAAKVLESRGLARCLYTFGGADAELTGEGRLYVEEDRGTTPEIRSHRENYFNISITGNNNQVVSGNQGPVRQALTIEQQRAPTFDLLREIENTLQQDQSLKGPQRLEAPTYIHLIRIQVEKEQPDLAVIAAVLDPLSKIPSIATKIANLASLLNG